ncbi:MAG: M48 family peptidase [Clostridia bacterium]|nr:M48 family peptidase [Clostridia bacterium]
MQIILENQKMECRVIYRKRKTLCIQVRPPGDVTVISPKGKTEAEILWLVQSKAKWIQKKLSEMQRIEALNTENKYVDGEAFSYLGQRYILQVRVHQKYKRLQVKIEERNLVVYTSKIEPESTRAALEVWYKKQAMEVIKERIAYYQNVIQIKPSQIVVKKQQKRWGSCTSKHKLLFNFRCVMLPHSILDYIVVHELCHLLQLNHSKEFWRLVEEILPDYKQRKQWLRTHGVEYDL